MQEIINIILLGLASLGVVVEITPIKFNPLSKILEWLGKNFNTETTKNILNIHKIINDLSDKVKKLDEESKANRKKYLQIAISDFASDLRHNQVKSESQFMSIIELCDEYRGKGYNGKIKLDAEFIKSEYLKLGGKVQKGEIKMLKE